MKKVIVFLMVLVLLCGCESKNKRTIVNPEKSKVSVKASVPPENTEDVKNENTEQGESETYLTAFAEKLKELINEYGGYPYIKYGDLVDFEKDGVPELVVLCKPDVRGKIMVYRYDEGKATKVYEKALGERMGHFDVSYELAVNKSSANPCIITFQSENPWVEECLHVFKIENKTVCETILLGKSSIALDEEGFNFEDPFDSFEINNLSVSKEDFYKEYNKVLDGVVIIDAVAEEEIDFIDDKRIFALESELVAFLSEFEISL